MADKVVVSIAVLFLAFFLQYAFQWYRAHYHIEAILDDVGADESLELHTQEFDQPEVIKVTSGIYVAVGFALANSILIEAPEGNIIVDTTESVDSAQRIREAFQNVSTGPLKAIIYTHNHPDHTFGAEAFIDDTDKPPEIWAHHLMLEQLQRIAVTGPLIYKRSMKQFGRYLTSKSLVNSGIGPRLLYDKRHGIVYPNKLVYEDIEVTIAGLPVYLVHIPGETSDHLGIWIPEKSVFLPGDDIYKTFPNLYAIRGTPSRDVMKWVKSLDKILNLEPNFLVPSHTKPIIGKQNITDIVTIYRDAIQFVHDQTVRYMNKGMHPDDIVRRITLPDHLKQHAYLQQFYGTIEWSVKGVFDSYMGWFSGDVMDLKSIGTNERAEKLIELGGGIKSVLKKSEKALRKGDIQWSLELSSSVLRVQATHKYALDLRTRALKILAEKETSANGRNYYLMTILEDRNTYEKILDHKVAIMKIPMRQIFVAMSTKVKVEVCGDVDRLTVFNFTDTEEVFIGHLRNGIFHVTEQAKLGRAPDIKVSTTAFIWRSILGESKSPAMAYISGDLRIEGGLWAFVQWMQCFDREKV